jgi:hypothetical protein
MNLDDLIEFNPINSNYSSITANYHQTWNKNPNPASDEGARMYRIRAGTAVYD